MTYEWTKEQLAKLTPGCSVMVDEDRRLVMGTFEEESVFVQGDYAELDSDEYELTVIDPSTIEPPSMETLQRWAEAKLGEGAVVLRNSERGVSVESPGVSGTWLQRVLDLDYAEFRGPNAARHCAIWLHALPEVV